MLRCAHLFVTPWTAACQVPLSMGFSRQEHWSGLPWPPPGDLPDPGIEPTSLAYLALAGGFLTTEPPGKPVAYIRGSHWSQRRLGSSSSGEILPSSGWRAGVLNKELTWSGTYMRPEWTGGHWTSRGCKGTDSNGELANSYVNVHVRTWRPPGKAILSFLLWHPCSTPLRHPWIPAPHQAGHFLIFPLLLPVKCTSCVSLMFVQAYITQLWGTTYPIDVIDCTVIVGVLSPMAKKWLDVQALFSNLHSYRIG